MSRVLLPGLRELGMVLPVSLRADDIGPGTYRTVAVLVTDVVG